jgi:hypothetical protein
MKRGKRTKGGRECKGKRKKGGRKRENGKYGIK